MDLESEYQEMENQVWSGFFKNRYGQNSIILDVTGTRDGCSERG
jgi:hypothetical protein